MHGALNFSPARHFAIFRIVFGAYLCIHFVGIMPHAAELFSRNGMLPDAELNLTAGILPNPLEVWDTPFFCEAFVVGLAILSLLYSLGLWRRSAAILIWFGWACLFNRNNLISNPSLPYTGTLLLLSAIVPAGEPWTFSRKKSVWQMPAMVPVTAWILMALGYTVSGAFKAISPSWQDGSALWHVLHNPLARPGLVRDLILTLPPDSLRLLTWVVLVAEILFLPMCLHHCTRRLAWIGMVLIHGGILLSLDFADLTVGMLMVHLFTFPQILSSKRRSRASAVITASDSPAPALPFSPDFPPDAWPGKPELH